MNGLANVLRNIDNFANLAMYILWLVAQEHAVDMEAYAKAHAPWTDRTGDARKTLKGTAQQDAISTAIQIAHGMPYGEYLEHANSGKFAILWPTIQNEYAQFIGDIEALFGKLVNGDMS